MNIILVAVTLSGVAFLVRFLVALIREQKSAPQVLRAYLLNNSLVTKGGRVQGSIRVKLYLVEPEELPAKYPSSTFGAKVTHAEKWG
jgi:hypothetical protein